MPVFVIIFNWSTYIQSYTVQSIRSPPPYPFLCSCGGFLPRGRLFPHGRPLACGRPFAHGCDYSAACDSRFFDAWPPFAWLGSILLFCEFCPFIGCTDFTRVTLESCLSCIIDRIEGLCSSFEIVLYRIDIILLAYALRLPIARL